MREVAYELFHVGIKLKPIVDLNILKEKIEGIAPKKGYKIIKKGIFNPNNNVLERVILVSKEGTNIELFCPSHALNSVGKEPVQVTNTFKDVLEFLEEMGYDPQATISFYELLADMSIKTNKKPIEVLTDSSKIDISAFREIDKTSITSILISNKTEVEESEIFSLIVGPNPVSPNNNFAFKLQYQSKENEKIILFQKSLEQRITKFVESIERR